MVERTGCSLREIKMKTTPAEIEKYVKLLEETPLRISRMIQGVDETRLQFKSDKNEWSANDILAHLRACADVWGDSIEKMIATDGSTLPYVHPRQWVKNTGYHELPFGKSFQAFKAQRRKLLKMLKNLPFEDWARGAIIKGREHTVFSQVRRMAKHESEHVGQIESLLK